MVCNFRSAFFCIATISWSVAQGMRLEQKDYQDIQKRNACFLYNTPLHDAVFSHNYYMVNKLLVEGANPYLVNSLGFSPLKFAIRMHYNDIVAAFLGVFQKIEFINVSNHFLIDLENRYFENETPLHWAAEFNNAKAIELLLARGAKIDCIGNKGKTPIYTALRCGNYEIAEYLKQRGAKITEEEVFAAKKEFQELQLEQKSERYWFGNEY